MGVGWIACRQIPCFCLSCVEHLKEDWVSGKERNQQPRYAQNKICLKWNVFQGENDWEIVEIKYQHKKDGSNEEEINEMQIQTSDMILDNMESQMAREAKVDLFGVHAIIQNNKSDFEVFKLLSESYEICLSEYNGNLENVTEVCDGNLVAKAKVFAKLGLRGNPSKWYMPPEQTEEIVVRFRQVINSNVPLLPISPNNYLPHQYPQGIPPFTNRARGNHTNDQLRRMGLARKMSEEVHDEILDEIERRETIDYEQDVYDDLETPQSQDNIDDDEDSYGNEENKVDIAFA